jgi:hypothetical protein
MNRVSERETVVELPFAADSCPCVVEAAHRVTISCWYPRQCGAVGVHPITTGAMTRNPSGRLLTPLREADASEKIVTCSFEQNRLVFTHDARTSRVRAVVADDAPQRQDAPLPGGGCGGDVRRLDPAAVPQRLQVPVEDGVARRRALVGGTRAHHGTQPQRQGEPAAPHQPHAGARVQRRQRRLGAPVPSVSFRSTLVLLCPSTFSGRPLCLALEDTSNLASRPPVSKESGFIVRPAPGGLAATTVAQRPQHRPYHPPQEKCLWLGSHRRAYDSQRSAPPALADC